MFYIRWLLRPVRIYGNENKDDDDDDDDDEQLVKLYIIVTVCWQSCSGSSGGKLFLVSKFCAVSSPLELQTICERLLC
jgi:hypothetical protein